MRYELAFTSKVLTFEMLREPFPESLLIRLPLELVSRSPVGVLVIPCNVPITFERTRLLAAEFPWDSRFSTESLRSAARAVGTKETSLVGMTILASNISTPDGDPSLVCRFTLLLFSFVGPLRTTTDSRPEFKTLPVAGRLFPLVLRTLSCEIGDLLASLPWSVHAGSGLFTAAPASACFLECEAMFLRGVLWDNED